MCRWQILYLIKRGRLWCFSVPSVIYRAIISSNEVSTCKSHPCEPLLLLNCKLTTRIASNACIWKWAKQRPAFTVSTTRGRILKVILKARLSSSYQKYMRQGEILDWIIENVWICDYSAVIKGTCSLSFANPFICSYKKHASFNLVWSMPPLKCQKEILLYVQKKGCMFWCLSVYLLRCVFFLTCLKMHHH